MDMKRGLLLILLGIFSFGLFAQEYIVKFPRVKSGELPSYLSVDKVQGDSIIAYIWGEENYSRFKNLFPEAVDLPKAGANKSIVMATTVDQMSNWDRYPVYEVYVEMMQRFAQKYPYLVRLDTIGMSQRGRLLLAVKITDNPDKQEFEPQVFYTSSMHGDELTGYIVLLRLIDYLLKNYNKDSLITYLINNYEIYINPLANPDGAYAGGNNTVSGAIRYYANGQDPNRDFFPGPLNGDQQGSPETEAMKRYAASHSFIMSMNFHGGSEVYNYPWDVWTSAENAHADDTWFRVVGKRYVDTARKVDANYMTDVTASGITEGGDWYKVTGSRQDYMNFVRHCKEVTLEMSSTKLVRSDQLPYFWNINYKSLIYYLLEAERGLQGIVLDSDGKGDTVRVKLIGYDRDSSLIYSYGANGRYFRPLLPGNYRVQLFDTATKQLILDTNYQVNDGRNFLSYIPLPRANRITFFVKDVEGKSLANVEIKVYPVARDYHTDLAGIDTAILSSGIYEIHIIDTALNYHQVFYESIYRDDTLRYILPSSVITDSNEITNEAAVAVYPVPASDYVYIRGKDLQEVEIFSLSGKKILSRQVDMDFLSIDISSLPAGIYLMHIRSAAGISIRKFLVE